MDENLTNVIEKALGDYRTNADQEQVNHCLESFVSDRVYDAGYRLDPYPNGKSKVELIDEIAARQNTIYKARAFLRVEHSKWVAEAFGISIGRHVELEPTCPVCTFLAETSSVKS